MEINQYKLERRRNSNEKLL